MGDQYGPKIDNAGSVPPSGGTRIATPRNTPLRQPFPWQRPSLGRDEDRNTQSSQNPWLGSLEQRPSLGRDEDRNPGTHKHP